MLDMLDGNAILGEGKGLEAEADGEWMSDGIPMSGGGGMIEQLVILERRGGQLDDFGRRRVHGVIGDGMRTGLTLGIHGCRWEQKRTGGRTKGRVLPIFIYSAP